MIILLLLLLLPGLVFAQVPVVDITQVGMSYQVVYESSNRTRQVLPLPAAEYADMTSHGRGEPPTRPPPDGQTYQQLGAMGRPVFSTMSGYLDAPGSVVVTEAHILIVVSTTDLCMLERAQYTVSRAGGLTLTPAPPFGTVVAGLITVTNARWVGEQCTGP